MYAQIDHPERSGDPDEQLDLVFSALANATRRAIVARLSSGDATVNELAQPFEMTLPAISKHLKVLERAGLIERSRHAQFRPCRLNAERLAAATEWAERCRVTWLASFDRLERQLASDQPQPSSLQSNPAKSSPGQSSPAQSNPAQTLEE